MTLVGRLLVVFASLVIVFACERRGAEKDKGGSAVLERTPKSEVLGTLQRVITEEGSPTTDVARGVRVIRGENDLTPEEGMELREGDRIITDGRTQVLINLAGVVTQLPTDSEVTLPKRSELSNFRIETKYRPAGPLMREARVPAEGDPKE